VGQAAEMQERDRGPSAEAGGGTAVASGLPCEGCIGPGGIHHVRLAERMNRGPCVRCSCRCGQTGKTRDAWEAWSESWVGVAWRGVPVIELVCKARRGLYEGQGANSR
jgi:hypothetical protein